MFLRDNATTEKAERKTLAVKTVNWDHFNGETMMGIHMQKQVSWILYIFAATLIAIQNISVLLARSDWGAISFRRKF